VKKRGKRVEVGCQKYLFTCTGIRIFSQWAIAIISKNQWPINFGLVGDCPIAHPLDTPLIGIYLLRKKPKKNFPM
jgi:hypothetical protein